MPLLRACSRLPWPPIARPSASIPTCPPGVVHTLWQRGDFEQLLAQTASDGQMARCFALLALGRQPEAIEAWEGVAKTFSPLTPGVREWIDAVREFLTLSEVSRPAVFKNLDGAFDPEEIFFVGTQAARLGMPEALTILGRAVDAGYAAADTLARHPWIAPIRGQPGFADVLRRAEQARESGRRRLPRGRRSDPARALVILASGVLGGR